MDFRALSRCGLNVFGALILGSLIACSTAETTATRSSPRILQTENSDAPSENLIRTESAIHKIAVQPDKVLVTTHLSLSGLVNSHGHLVLQNDDPDTPLTVEKIEVNGRGTPSTPLGPQRNAFALPLEDSTDAARVTLTYSFPSKATDENFSLLSTTTFLRASRLADSPAGSGYDLRSLHKFSYAEPVRTSVSVSLPQTHFVLGSSPIESEIDGETHFRTLHGSRFTMGIANRKIWNQSTFSHLGTRFTLLRRKRDGVIDPREFRETVKPIWTAYTSRFGTPTDHVVVVDSDWDAFSGGMLGNNVIGIFSKNRISPDEQKWIKDDFGWKPRSTTRAYVGDVYSRFKNPWSAYLNEMVAHELAHLYFGFGQTVEKVLEPHALWFSLGMGMVYDAEISRKLNGADPVFFAAVIRNWESKYKLNSQLDQRLEFPDTSRDREFGLSRLHIYAHGKAYAYLNALRTHLGPEVFDAGARRLLQPGAGNPVNYSTFRLHLPTQELEPIEKQWLVR